jgi:hypothetical protein
MNRFILTSAIALSALVLGQQRASAWCEFKFCHSCNLSYTSTGHNWCFSSKDNGPPPCYACNYGQQPPAPAPAPNPVPPPTPVQKSAYDAWNYGGYQPVGYYVYPQAGYGFYQPQAGNGFYQAPSYWYGR